MKNKSMKVYQGTGTSDVTIPRIVLQGKWLKELGFSVGDQITISYAEDKITIMRLTGKQDEKSTESEENVCAK